MRPGADRIRWCASAVFDAAGRWTGWPTAMGAVLLRAFLTVYWATLTAAGKRGAATAADVLTGAGRGLGLNVDHIYWAGASQTISSANLDGSDPQTLVSGQNGPIGVAVDASHLYWTNQNDGSIWSANRDGTSPHVISNAGLAGWDIAVGGDHLYWTVLGRPPSGGAIWEANLDGSRPHAIVTGQDAPFGVAADSSHVYWTNELGGTVNEANLDGTGPRSIVTTGVNQPLMMAVAPPTPPALSFTPLPSATGRSPPGRTPRRRSRWSTRAARPPAR
jgi:hypothetical protein